MSVEPQDILAFWFDQSGPKKWFAKSDGFDADIRLRFEDAAIDSAQRANRSAPHPWEAEAESALALIIMLDQFPRNMYRATQAMFTWDSAALSVAKRAVGNKYDLQTDQSRRAFFYMPYMHSETMADQEECIRLIERGLDNENTLHHARAHRKLIERFGRFPHRNDILGRTSNSEEQAFLDSGGYAP